MTAQVAQWPVAQPLAAGDDLTCLVVMPVDADLSVDWRAAVREYPEGPVVAEFTVTPDEANHRLVLTMPGDVSATLRPGMGFDLTQLTPIERTLFVVDAINIVGAYSHGVT